MPLPAPCRIANAAAAGAPTTSSRAAPADSAFEQGRERPADSAREAGDQRDPGDRVARVASVQAHQRGERRLVQPTAHADAEDRPGEEQAPGTVRGAERDEAEREH